MKTKNSIPILLFALLFSACDNNPIRNYSKETTEHMEYLRPEKVKDCFTPAGYPSSKVESYDFLFKKGDDTLSTSKVNFIFDENNNDFRLEDAQLSESENFKHFRLDIIEMDIENVSTKNLSIQKVAVKITGFGKTVRTKSTTISYDSLDREIVNTQTDTSQGEDSFRTPYIISYVTPKQDYLLPQNKTLKKGNLYRWSQKTTNFMKEHSANFIDIGDKGAIYLIRENGINRNSFVAADVKMDDFYEESEFD